LEAIIFDWGGTLSVWADVDLEDMWRLAARHISAGQEEELIQELIAVEARTWARVSTDRRSARLAELLEAASQSLGVDVAAAVLEEAAAHHLDSWTPHIRHHDSAVSVLRGLRAMGLRIGLLSNTHWPRGFHEEFLERDGLAQVIDARLYTSELPFVKPDPSAFATALAALDVRDPSRAVFVGDRLYDDIWGAQNAGLFAVWVRNTVTPDFDVTPDAVIDGLSDLPELLPSMTRMS
jgi:putative hydrolase of the HAD superfamily